METLLIDVAVIKANYATREDVESVRGELQSSLASANEMAGCFAVYRSGYGIGAGETAVLNRDARADSFTRLISFNSNNIPVNSVAFPDRFSKTAA
ncbi:hypothetical protein [Erwinia sp. E_sp_B01_9]|uniref:hypothetical protein n=1 Tax=Erwinia sp. E_sp_B01_9 TaxID=3039403 RepID=UPI003D9BCE27